MKKLRDAKKKVSACSLQRWLRQRRQKNRCTGRAAVEVPSSSAVTKLVGAQRRFVKGTTLEARPERSRRVPSETNLEMRALALEADCPRDEGIIYGRRNESSSAGK